MHGSSCDVTLVVVVSVLHTALTKLLGFGSHLPNQSPDLRVLTNHGVDVLLHCEDLGPGSDQSVTLKLEEVSMRQDDTTVEELLRNRVLVVRKFPDELSHLVRRNSFALEIRVSEDLIHIRFVRDGFRNGLHANAHMRLSLDKVLYDEKNLVACRVIQLGECFEHGIYSKFMRMFKNSLNVALLEN
jgi:hypothetical protein